MIKTMTKEKDNINRYETKAIEKLLEKLIHIDTSANFFNLCFSRETKTIDLNQYLLNLLSECLGFKIRRKHIPVIKIMFRKYGIVFRALKPLKHPVSRLYGHDKAISIPC